MKSFKMAQQNSIRQSAAVTLFGGCTSPANSSVTSIIQP